MDALDWGLGDLGEIELSGKPFIDQLHVVFFLVVLALFDQPVCFRQLDCFEEVRKVLVDFNFYFAKAKAELVQGIGKEGLEEEDDEDCNADQQNW